MIRFRAHKFSADRDRSSRTKDRRSESKEKSRSRSAERTSRSKSKERTDDTNGKRYYIGTYDFCIYLVLFADTWCYFQILALFADT